jgi:hypothetical protein
MSKCCFPKIACCRGKNKVRSASETIERNGPAIKLNSSIAGKLKLSTSKLENSQFLNPIQASPVYKRSLSGSHKSTIVVRSLEKFEPIQKFYYEKDQSFSGLSISHISKNSVDQSMDSEFLEDISLVMNLGIKEKIYVPKALKESEGRANAINKEYSQFTLSNPCFSRRFV